MDGIPDKDDEYAASTAIAHYKRWTPIVIAKHLSLSNSTMYTGFYTFEKFSDILIDLSISLLFNSWYLLHIAEYDL